MFFFFFLFLIAVSIPAAPGGVDLTNVQENSFDVIFTTPLDAGREIVVQYKEPGASSWETYPDTAVSSPFHIVLDPSTTDPDVDPNANAGKTFDVRVRTEDPDGVNHPSRYTAIIPVTTGTKKKNLSATHHGEGQQIVPFASSYPEGERGRGGLFFLSQSI